MPDIDTLMQEWPPEFEEILKEVKTALSDSCFQDTTII